MNSMNNISNNVHGGGATLLSNLNIIIIGDEHKNGEMGNLDDGFLFEVALFTIYLVFSDIQVRL